MRRKLVHVGVLVPLNTPAFRLHGRERGFVLITMTAATIAMFAVLGMAVDIGRMFIAKNETQAYCDSAALAAALALDGTTTGIGNAKTAVANSANTWNFNTSTVNNPTVTFATATGGPWDPSPNPATGYSYVRVSATVTLNLYFIPVVVAQKMTQNVISTATAGQIPITSFPQGLAPYSAVSTDNTPPNFGLVTGNQYTIQWPSINSNASCDPTNPKKIDNCFNSPPCTGETYQSKLAVYNAWASSESGYWGSTSNSSIEQEILDAVQLQPVSVGTNIEPVLTAGQKQSEAGYLDERANQDISTVDDTHLSDSQALSSYNSNSHNGRRLLPVPIVDPISTTNTSVIGYGSFLLYANGSPSNWYKTNTNGNSAFCAIYAGPYQVGSNTTGTGGTTGATYVKLVQ